MKYIAAYNAHSGKWFPRSKNSGKTVTTEELCDEISDSTVSAADVLAVLRSLRSAMTRHLCAGDKVKLDNIGTFYLVAEASGNGVAKEEDVTSSQINRVNVRFNAQKVSGLGGQNSIPALAAGTIRWERVSAVAPKDESETPEPTPSGGDTPDTPGGDTPGGDTPGGDTPGGEPSGGGLDD